MAEGTWSVLWLKTKENRMGQPAELVEMVRGLTRSAAGAWLDQNGNPSQVYFILEMGRGFVLDPPVGSGLRPRVMPARASDTGRD